MQKIGCRLESALDAVDTSPPNRIMPSFASRGTCNDSSKKIHKCFLSMLSTLCKTQVVKVREIT